MPSLKHTGHLSYLFLLLVLLNGCINGSSKRLEKGLVEYTITYPEAKADDAFMTSMMPQQMVLHFEGSRTRSDLTMGMGIMKASFITDAKKHQLITLLTIMDKKYALVLDSTKVNAELIRKEQWTFTQTDDNKEIAGYNCTKWQALGNRGDKMEVWTTDDITIEDPNWSTPLNGIKGFLLQYDMIVNKIHMRLQATKVQAAQIDAKAFDIPADFPEVKKEEMPEIFSQFFQ